MTLLSKAENPLRRFAAAPLVLVRSASTMAPKVGRGALDGGGDGS